MWFVYILKCADESLYTGITTNLERRFLEHKSGQGGRYTASHAVLEQVYFETCSTRSEALKRESRIKKWRRERKLDLIRAHFEKTSTEA